jgi:hypothetical protein
MGIDYHLVWVEISVSNYTQMNISIISTYGKRNSNEFGARKISRILLELAEEHLQSPETSHYISSDGIEKVKKKLAS